MRKHGCDPIRARAHNPWVERKTPYILVNRCLYRCRREYHGGTVYMVQRRKVVDREPKIPIPPMCSFSCILSFNKNQRKLVKCLKFAMLMNCSFIVAHAFRYSFLNFPMMSFKYIIHSQIFHDVIYRTKVV